MDESRRAEILAAYELRTRVFDDVARRRQRVSALMAAPSAPSPPVVPPSTLDFDASGRLTRRTYQVLSMIADGYANWQIAQGLRLAEGTVKTHVRRLLDTLSARNRAHAVAIGFRDGILSAPIRSSTRPNNSVRP